MIGAVMLAIGLFAQGLPAPAPAHVTVENRITVEAPKPDPQTIAEASVQSSEAILSTVIVPPPVQWVNELLSLPDVWRTTPDDLTWNNSAIRQMADLVRVAALALTGLAIFGVGVRLTLGQGTGFGRLLLGIILSVGNLAWWEIGIKLNNAITSAIGAPDLPSLIKPHLSVPSTEPGLLSPSVLGQLVLVLVYAIVSLLLIFSLLFRLGLIDVLIAAGSLALLCYATEQSEALATHYTRIAVGILFSQILIVLGLRVASVLGTLGGDGLVGTLLSIVVLLLIRDLPRTLIAGGDRGQRQGHGMAYAAALIVRRRLGL